MSLVGLAAAVGSAVFNGSFIVPSKAEALKRFKIHPMVFQLYSALGVFVSSMLVIPFLSGNEEIAGDDDAGTELLFSPLGFLGGCIFVVSLVFSFLAVDNIGLALGQGVWGGIAILVSYLWGVAAFDETPSNVALSVMGVCVLICGVSVIAFCEPIGTYVAGQWDILGNGARSSMGDLYSPLSDEEYDFISRCSMGSMGRAPQKRPTMDRIPEEEEGESEAGWSKLSRHNTILKDPYTEKMRFRVGMSMACTVGLFGGSILVPLHYVPNAEKGLVFLPSFGAGTIVAAPIALMLYSVWSEEGMPGLFFWETLPYGLLSGCIFNAGNLLSIIAIPFLGYGVAYPILQCAIFVSGMWGVFYMRELQDTTAVCVFFAGGFVLISGAVVLAVAR